MFNAAMIPMWVAIIAAVSALLGPFIQGMIHRRSPMTKADAAEKFTAIAARVADRNEKLEKDLASLRDSVIDLVVILDEIGCDSKKHPKYHAQLLIVKKRMHGI